MTSKNEVTIPDILKMLQYNELLVIIKTIYIFLKSCLSIQ